MVIITIKVYGHQELDEALLCERKPIKFNDKYAAISVVKDDIIRHLSRAI